MCTPTCPLNKQLPHYDKLVMHKGFISEWTVPGLGVPHGY